MFSLCLGTAPARASTLDSQIAMPSTPKVAAADAGVSIGRGSPDSPVAAVSFSRAADLIGTPLNMASRNSAPSGAAASRLGTAAFTGPFSMPGGMPVAARALTSGFGFRQHPVLGGRRAHLGLDLAAASGSPIFATSDGVVAAGGWSGGYGLLVALDHGRGVQTRYGHMSRIAVAPGQRVRRGEVIGFVGSTGLSTGPHLHYEMRIDGRPVNPASTLGGK